MLNRIYTIIDANIRFVFGFISFQRGYEQKVDEEMTRYYKEKVNQEFNKINNEISNN